MIARPKTPVAEADVCAQYKLTQDEFAALSANLRGLYRAAYCADVLHIVEGAGYDPETGDFTEGPPYNNVGPDVNRFLKMAGADPGEPWCASFGTAMLLDSGVARSALPTLAASVVQGWIAWGKEHGLILDAPIRGCAALIKETETAGHWTWVADVLENHKVAVVAGNTNPGGSRDGYGVFRRTYRVSAFHCFVDLSKLTS